MWVQSERPHSLPGLVLRGGRLERQEPPGAGHARRDGGRGLDSAHEMGATVGHASPQGLRPESAQAAPIARWRAAGPARPFQAVMVRPGGSRRGWREQGRRGGAGPLRGPKGLLGLKARCGGVRGRGVAGYGSRKIGGGGGVNVCATLAGRAASSAVLTDAAAGAGRAASCAGRRSPPSRRTATSGITGTDRASLPCLCCIFPCRAEPGLTTSRAGLAANKHRPRLTWRPEFPAII